MSGPGAGATGATGTGDTTGATGTTGGTGTAAAVTLTDDQILQVLHIANMGEIDQAKLVQTKAKNAKVKAFAAMMIKDHTAADTRGTNLAKQAKLTPSDSPVSTMLKADSDKTVEQLKTQTGADLERAYIDAQVKAHQTVLDTIDTKLMPNVKDAGIKTMLTETRPKIEMHLKEAQDIQKALGGGTGTTGATGGTTGATGGATGTTGTTGATGGATGATGATGTTGGTTGKTGTTK
jgi:putative membrane protein